MRIVHIARASVMLWNFLRPVFRRQQQLGHEIILCGSDDEYARRLREEGFRVWAHGLERRGTVGNLLGGSRRLQRQLRDNPVDAVICHSPLGAAVGRWAAWRAGVRHIIYMAHGLPCAPGTSRPRWVSALLMEKALGAMTSGLVVMNRYDDQLARRYRLIRDTHRVIRIPGMGVDTERFSPAATGGKTESGDGVRRSCCIPQDAIVVLQVSALLKAKGVFLTLEAARRILQTRQDLHFVLVGAGPCQQQLEAIIEAERLGQWVHLLGWQEDMPACYHAAEMVLLPTWYHEGLPVSILEAMACGKPVIATQHRGCEDAVMDGETGWLVPRRSLSSLMARILELADDPALRMRMGQAGRRRVEQQFSRDECTGQIVQAFETLLKQP